MRTRFASFSFEIQVKYERVQIPVQSFLSLPIKSCLQVSILCTEVVEGVALFTCTMSGDKSRNNWRSNSVSCHKFPQVPQALRVFVLGVQHK